MDWRRWPDLYIQRVSDEMRVNLIQMEVGNRVEDNLGRAGEMIDRSFESFAPDFVCLPEYFSTPTLSKPREEIFDEVYEPTISFLRAKSKELGIYIIGGSVLEKDGDDFYNTSFLFKNGELLGKYRKINLTELERLKLKKGGKCFVYDTGYVKIGILICADILSPKIVKTVASMGAEAIFLPISLPSEDHPSTQGHPASVAMARANSLFILKNGCVGSSSRGKRTGSRSAIVSPWGIVKEAREENTEEIVSADLDLEKLRNEAK